MVQVVGPYRVWMQLQAGKVCHPQQRSGIARNDLFCAPAGRKTQRDDFDPRRTATWRPLLVEELAAHAVGITHEDVGAVSRAAERALCDGKVVAGEIELREARFRKENFSWAGDRDF